MKHVKVNGRSLCGVESKAGRGDCLACQGLVTGLLGTLRVIIDAHGHWMCRAEEEALDRVWPADAKGLPGAVSDDQVTVTTHQARERARVALQRLVKP